MVQSFLLKQESYNFFNRLSISRDGASELVLIYPFALIILILYIHRMDFFVSVFAKKGLRDHSGSIPFICT